MFRKTAISVAAMALATGCVTAHAQNAPERPNVVFIMVDDMGHSDLSLTGSHHIATPHVDSLARDGLWLTQGYSSTPICSPTRTALLTGNYAQRYEIGVEEPLANNVRPDIGVPLDAPTLASVFRDLGYQTALVGKWHLGNPPVHGPLQHGYDRFYGVVEGAADYFGHNMIVGGRETGMGLTRGNAAVEEQGYLTDLFGDEAVEIIREADDQPFFLSLHFTAPHWPWEGREDEEVTATLRELQQFEGGSIEKYRELMQAMDDNVGRVLAALEAEGEADNTIVVFTSDNGAERFSESWPFIGYKGEVLEGGIRVPILIRWPGHVVAGSTSGQVMSSMDFLPTLLGLAGGDPAAAGTFDGMDLSDQVLGAAPVERPLFWRFNAERQAAVRLGDWKYVSLGGKEGLYNLAEDARERANRAGVERERLEQMRDLWDA